MNQTQRNVLAHKVVDPDAWFANAVAVLGQERADAALAEKVARWEASYNTATLDPGYQTRAERQAVEDKATADRLTALAEQAVIDQKVQQLAVLDAILNDKDALGKLQAAVK